MIVVPSWLAALGLAAAAGFTAWQYDQGCIGRKAAVLCAAVLFGCILAVLLR